MTIAFDGATMTATLSTGTTSLSVRDLWGRWVDWFLTGDNSKYGLWMATLGGDDIDPVAGTKIPVYLFLNTGVYIKPQEANHTLDVTDGILLVAGGGDPFINTTGNYVVRIKYQQPVQAISYTIGGTIVAGLTVDQATMLARIEKFIRNASKLDPATGQRIIYDDDSVTPLATGTAYKDAAGTQLYDGVSPVHKTSRLA